MVKYTPVSQLSFDKFTTPFKSELCKDNRWVKLANIIPWDALANEYIKQLNSRFGRQSIDVRMVIGAIIIKH